MPQLLSNEIAYLIDKVNKVLSMHGSKNYVTASVEVIDMSQDDVMQIDLNYILIEPTQKIERIFSSSVRIDKEFFVMNRSAVLADLHESFFIEVLLHTDFTNKPVK